ncbi:MAG TPA: GDSL-type esterase/lipase family protein [Nitrospira sp.]
MNLLFIGDSITQGWMDDGRRVWDIYYGRRSAVNLGFNKDCTEHVLWRLTHGEIQGIAPRLIVLMIGTNNTGIRQDSPQSTAEGVQTILATLRAALPDSKILLLAIFPRGALADHLLRRLNAAINDRIKAYADNRHIFFLDIGRSFLDAQGSLSRDLMPDELHPNERGYQVWAEGMEKRVNTLLEQ